MLDEKNLADSLNISAEDRRETIRSHNQIRMNERFKAGIKNLLRFPHCLFYMPLLFAFFRVRIAIKAYNIPFDDYYVNCIIGLVFFLLFVCNAIIVGTPIKAQKRRQQLKNAKFITSLDNVFLIWEGYTKVSRIKQLLFYSTISPDVWQKALKRICFNLVLTPAPSLYEPIKAGKGNIIILTACDGVMRGAGDNLDDEDYG